MRQIVCHSAPMHLVGRLCATRHLCISLGEIRSAMVRMMSVSLSRVKCYVSTRDQVYADCEIILRVAPQASVNGLLLMAGEVIS